MKWILRLSLFVKKVAGIKRVVPEKIESGTMEAVGAALGHDVDDAARAAAVFCFRV